MSLSARFHGCCSSSLFLTRSSLARWLALVHQRSLHIMSSTSSTTFSAPLCAAARDGDIALIQKLVLEGETLHSFARRSPLHWAAREGHAEACRLLIELQADINARDSKSDTALTLSSWQVRLLLLVLVMERSRSTQRTRATATLCKCSSTMAPRKRWLTTRTERASCWHSSTTTSMSPSCSSPTVARSTARPPTNARRSTWLVRCWIAALCEREIDTNEPAFDAFSNA